jgi:hypothetical protein
MAARLVLRLSASSAIIPWPAKVALREAVRTGVMNLFRREASYAEADRRHITSCGDFASRRGADQARRVGRRGGACGGRREDGMRSGGRRRCRPVSRSNLQCAPSAPRSCRSAETGRPQGAGGAPADQRHPSHRLARISSGVRRQFPVCPLRSPGIPGLS